MKPTLLGHEHTLSRKAIDTEVFKNERKSKIMKQEKEERDFPGDPVVKNPLCKGRRSDPWSGNYGPTCCGATEPTSRNY